MVFSCCFSPQASDDTHIMFINTIHNNDSEVITRNYINITFVCRYPINYMVQQPNGENMIRVDVRLLFYFNIVAVICFMDNEKKNAFWFSPYRGLKSLILEMYKDLTRSYYEMNHV